MEHIASDRVEAEQTYDMKVVCSDMGYHRAARAEAEADMDSAETSEEQQIALAEGSSRTTGTEPQGASTGQDTATGQSGVGQADSQDKTNDESGPTARRRRNS
jgi:hypothetical protein